MIANHIYINPQGVPCVPPERFGHPSIYSDPDEVKDSCIPIREEDQQYAWDKIEGYPGFKILEKDKFMPVEPYEFEVVLPATGEHAFGMNHFAHIIRPQEPKPEPKELYSIKELEWIERSEDVWMAQTEFGPLFVYRGGAWRWNGIWIYGDCVDAEDGKNKVREHFESKIKQCLKREV